MKKGNIDSDQAAAIYDRRRLVQKGGIVLRMPVVGMVTESKLVVMDVVTPQPIVDFALAARPEIVMGMGVDTEVKISCFWRPWNPPQMYEIDPAQGGLEAKITRVGMVAATANLFTSPEFRGQMDRVVGEASEVMRVDLRSAREMEEILRHIPLPAVTAVIQETLPGALEAHLRTHYGVELMPSSVGVDVRYPPYLTLLSQAQAEAAAQRAKLRVQEEFWGNVADVAASAINKVIDHLGTVVVQAAGAWSPAGYGAVG
jgi:hypothetical protein